jgi:hypothetical protein
MTRHQAGDHPRRLERLAAQAERRGRVTQAVEIRALADAVRSALPAPAGHATGVRLPRRTAAVIMLVVVLSILLLIATAVVR